VPEVLLPRDGVRHPVQNRGDDVGLSVHIFGNRCLYSSDSTLRTIRWTGLSMYCAGSGESRFRSSEA
jgi:hypothetical protein